jgi:hypothetical protein
MRLIKLRNAQEELVGFGIIIVLVAIIALIFLGIGLRSPSEMKNSLEVSDFIYSSLSYSVDCQEQITNINDLIVACYNSKGCKQGESCELLKSTYEDMIESSLRIGNEMKYKAYIFRVFSGDNTLVFLDNGNKTGSLTGASARILSGETINVSLVLYY